MAEKGSEYKKTEVGGITTFEVIPAAGPKYWYIIILGIIAILFGLMVGGIGLLIMLLIGGGAIWLGWFRDPRPKGTHEPMSFKVSPDSLEGGGQTFKKADIHRLIIKNSISDQEVPYTVLTTSQGMIQGGLFRAQASKTANTLNVETGGKSTLLAGGMDNTTAYGLLTDVTRILGMQIS
jgi:hypothetical protein